MRKMEIKFKVSKYQNHDIADISCKMQGGLLEDYYPCLYSKDQWRGIVDDFGDALYEILHWCPQEKEEEIKQYIAQSIGIEIKEKE